jgi:hypothetical protein
MSRGMSAPMITECRLEKPRLYHTVDLALAGGTRLWSDTDIASDTLGLYRQKVLDWGGDLALYDVADLNYSIVPIELAPTVADADKDLSNYLESSNADTLVLSPPAVTIKLISPNVTPANWFTLFTGIFVKWGFPTPGRVKLYFRTNTIKLEAPYGRLLAPGDFPFADPSARAQIAPMVYGTHDSGGEKGQIPSLLVDVNRNWFLLSVGWLKSVDRVYVGGVQQSAFTILHPIVNGRVYTVVSFTSTPTGDVTADVTGYETNGDGTGTLIDNPADVIKHFLVNWVYGDYMSGAWLADATAPVDTAEFAIANAFLARYSHKASKYLDGNGEQQALDVLNEWCLSFLCRVGWTNLGKIAIVFEDLDAVNLILDDPWLVEGKNCQRDLSRDDETLTIISRVEGAFLFSQQQSRFTNSVMVQDPGTLGSAPFGKPDKLTFPWSYAGQ